VVGVKGPPGPKGPWLGVAKRSIKAEGKPSAVSASSTEREDGEQHGE
jgi:hypothetical protein